MSSEAKAKNNRNQNLKKPSGSYVDGSSAWKIFAIFFFLACILGVGTRIYFSPNRIKSWITEALEREKAPAVRLQFKTAKLSLSRGSIPQLAVEFRGVEVTPHAACESASAISIEKLDLPLRLSSVFTGKIAFGVARADNVTLDIDGLKNPCNEVEPERKTASEAASATAAADAVQPGSWWKEHDISAVQRVLSGVALTNSKILFEKKTKFIYLDSFDARISRESKVQFTSLVRIPENLSYGEKLPALSLSGYASATEGEIAVRAGLSEGTLELRAKLKALEARRIFSNVEVHVANVPLSTLVPLFQKTKIVKNEFKPRFFWLECRAKIEGEFQGLLERNPMTFENCSIKGSGSSIEMAYAIRKPDASFEPFEVKITKLGLQRLLETFDWKGPGGIASEYGELNGVVKVSSQKAADFSGEIINSKLIFSSRSIRAQQLLPRMGVQLELSGDTLSGAINEVAIDRGEFLGKLKFQIMRDAGSGKIEADIEQLKFHPDVEKLITGGSWQKLNASAKAELKNKRLHSLIGSLKFAGLISPAYEIPNLAAQTTFRLDQEFSLQLRADQIDVKESSPFVAAFDSNQIEVEKPLQLNNLVVRGSFPKAGGFEWDQAQAELSKSKKRLMSRGTFTRDRYLSGSLSMDGRGQKKQTWPLSGTWDAPDFKLDQ